MYHVKSHKFPISNYAVLPSSDKCEIDECNNSNTHNVCVTCLVGLNSMIQEFIGEMLIITVRKPSCRKVMFLHLSVILFTGDGGVHTSYYSDTPCPPGQTAPPGRHPPPPRDGHCSGRYASYWNAFLFLF